MPTPAAMQIGYSLASWHQPEKVLPTLEQLDAFDYQRIEFQAHGVDNWIEYPVLEKLNAHKRYSPEHLARMRAFWQQIKQRGKQVGIWVHDLWFPRDVLELYPELATPRGDINLSHPLIEAFIRGRLETFFKLAPEVDFFILTMTETTYPVMQRFDNEMSPIEATRWLLGIYDDLARQHGKEVVIRPFSALRHDYSVVKDALGQGFEHLPVMLKSDPFDWNHFLGCSEYLKQYPGRHVVMEMDISAEYYACNLTPAVLLPYIRERLEYAEQLGVKRVMVRLTRYGLSTLDGPNRINAQYLNAFFKLDDRDPKRFLESIVPAEYPDADAAGHKAIAQLLGQSMDVLAGIFWVNGQRLFHSGLFGHLRTAINVLIFETMRPNHSLAHAEREWAILTDRPTLSFEDALREKDQALAGAQQMLDLARGHAQAYPQLIRMCENLVLLARVYQRFTVLVQAYLQRVADPNAEDLSVEAEALREAAREIVVDQGDTPRFAMQHESGSLDEHAARFADDLEQTFAAERAIRRQYPLGVAGLEDVIFPGFPNEGHNPAKTTHGAGAIFEDGRWSRQISHTSLGYTSRVAPGRKRLGIEVRGRGRFIVNDQTLGEFHDRDWTTYTFDVDCPSGELKLLTEKRGTPNPAIRLITVHQAQA